MIEIQNVLEDSLVVRVTLLTDCTDPQELLNRTALETQKLELMTEVSSLKLKLTALERDHRGNEVDPLDQDSWQPLTLCF